ncbi:MAG: HIT family protein [Bdellovibrionaceae bacterium]|nr:HIT family protein [Pseudobdellovibrionaceae bacterium]
MASVFTRIIRGELPCYKIFEDDLTFSFLALDQVNPGHTLLVPKLEVNHWTEVPEDIYARLHLNSLRIGRAIREASGAPRVGQVVAGFEVPHYHLHMIPAWSIPDLDFRRARRLPPEEMEAVRQRIVAALR